jgi:hypothetical protein
VEMSYIFTDYNQMVGKRPREVYWRELQDAANEINRKLSSDFITVVSYQSATEEISSYQKGITTFQVMEDASSGYPTLDGIVETIYIDEFRNIQHYFDYTADDDNGKTYYRQWKPSLGQWTNWSHILTDKDLMKHADDITKHTTAVDRIRLDGYTHYQPAAETSWTIIHNMNKFPNVMVVDSGGNVMMSDIQHISKYELRLSFATPFAGTAYLS